mmetsp:Transcript_56267/g.154637  ORF Transcript_56267/g.154637 Transcript_56267/m.154637 type:complete len:112 (+) Transcript_56267:376-711(+)
MPATTTNMAILMRVTTAAEETTAAAAATVAVATRVVGTTAAAAVILRLTREAAGALAACGRAVLLGFVVQVPCSTRFVISSHTNRVESVVTTCAASVTWADSYDVSGGAAH